MAEHTPDSIITTQRNGQTIVSSSEEPKENFQANDDIVGAAVYQYGDNIVVEFEGKYWLYEHYHNTDFDGNSD